MLTQEVKSVQIVVLNSTLQFDMFVGVLLSSVAVFVLVMSYVHHNQ